MNDSSIDCLPGVFVYRFSFENGLEAAGEIFHSIRQALGEHGIVVGIPNNDTLEYMTKAQLLEVRNSIDELIDGRD